MTGSNNPETVNIEMVLPFDSLDEEHELNIPADVVGEVVETVFGKFTNTLNISEDNVNNNIEN